MEEENEKREGVELEVDEDTTEIIENEDGSATVIMDEPTVAENAEFYMNLAEEMPSADMQEIANSLLEFIERDKQARTLRDKQYEEGLRRTGLGEDAPGGAQFQGASKVVHPMLTEACVDFSSRVTKELLPANGPVKEYIPGEVTQEKLEKALRKKKFMNWQLTEQMIEFRPEMEQTTTQIPLGGVQYTKLYWDEQKDRPIFMFVPIDDIYLPYSATSFYSAERKTHVQRLTKLEFEKRINAGMYREIDLTSPKEPEQSAPAKANDKIEGKEQTSYNEDGLRTLFEVACYLDFEDNFGLAPYLVTIDESSRQVLSIYRNWDEDDQKQEELIHIIEWPFVPWRGAYPIGLPHMIGSLSAAATGALRALLDSAHINNFPGMLKLKGGSRGGQSDRIEPTQVTEIEGGVGVDDVRKIAMPVPFNPPNAVLFSLLGFVTDAAKGVVRTTFEDLKQASPQQPVGTTLALIEQGMTVFSAIHARLHNSMQMTLRVLHRLNAKHLSDDYIKRATGELIAKAEDFRGPIDVIPVSDPNIFSEAQRFAQVQAVAQRAAAMPQLYDQRAVEELFLERLKIPNGKDLLVKRPEPIELNAVNENLALTLGKPVAAFPLQDHLAHLQVHLDYLRSPIFGSNPLIAPVYIPGVLQHIKEHMVYWYSTYLYEQASAATGVPLDQFLAGKDPEISAEVDRTLAMASQRFMPDISATFEGLPPIVMQAQQLLQQFKPQQPADPTQVLMAETQRKAQADQAKAQADQARIGLEQAKMASQTEIENRRMELERLRIQREMELDAIKRQEREMELEARMAMNREDNMTAKELAVFEAEQGIKTPYSTGRGINPNP
jgi:hypothetical protein